MPLAAGPRVGLVAVVFAAAVAAPLALYTVSLAALGLPHALAELRFVALRFAPRRPRTLLGVVAILLATIAGLKIADFTGIFHAPIAVELGLAATLAALALPRLWARGPLFAVAGLALVGGVAWGTATAPVPTLLTLAVLHTLTPLGFLAEGAGGPRRRQILLWAGLVFMGLPLLLASGAPLTLWQRALPLALEADPLGAGHLAEHFGAFFPRAWHQAPWILSAFAAVAFAQVMHQATVLTVLPRLVPTPTSRRVWLALGGVALVSLVAFSFDFFGARKAYAVVAAVHAWVELPILLAALAGPLAPRLGDASPSRDDARWPAGETGSLRPPPAAA